MEKIEMYSMRTAKLIIVASKRKIMYIVKKERRGNGT